MNEDGEPTMVPMYTIHQYRMLFLIFYNIKSVNACSEQGEKMGVGLLTKSIHVILLLNDCHICNQ